MKLACFYCELLTLNFSVGFYLKYHLSMQILKIEFVYLNYEHLFDTSYRGAGKGCEGIF